MSRAGVLFIALHLVAPCLVQAQASKPKPKPADARPAYLQVPFDITQADALNAGPRAHRLIDFLTPLSRLPEKDAFETQAQFEARLTAARSKPAVGSTSLDDLVAYQTLMPVLDEGGIGYSYSPERQELTYYVRPTIRAEKLCVINTVQYLNKKERSYIGENSFGVKRRISVETDFVTQLGVPCDSVPADREHFRGQWKWSIPMAADEARRGVFSVLTIGRFTQPGYYFEESKETATITEPVELTTTTFTLGLKPVAFWLIDSTGKIHHKGVVDGYAKDK